MTFAMEAVPSTLELLPAPIWLSRYSTFSSDVKSLHINCDRVAVSEASIDPFHLDEISLLKSVLRGPPLTHRHAFQLHSYIVLIGWDSNIQISNHLISMYGKGPSPQESRSVFDCMPVRDAVSWSTMLSIYRRHGESQHSLQLIKKMEQEGPEPDRFVLVNALGACAKPLALMDGQMIHQTVVNWGFELDHVVGTALMHMYGQCGSLEDAIMFFNKLVPCDTITWNCIMAACSHEGNDEDAFKVFHEMQQHCVTPDSATFVTVVTSCASLQDLVRGRLIHDQICRYGFENDSRVMSALISMYAKCSRLEESYIIFDRMKDRHLFVWNAMITAYVQQGQGKSSLNIFLDMQEQDIRPNLLTFLGLSQASVSVAQKEETELIHAHCVYHGFDSDLTVASTLVHSYGKCGCLLSAQIIFDKMQHHNVTSWNTIIGVFVEQGLGTEALDLFQRLLHKGIDLDEVTFINALVACSCVGDLDKGRVLHAHIVSAGKDMDIVVGNSIITMYGKCTALEDACNSFNRMQYQSTVSWNVIMGVFTELGQGDRGLDAYQQMKERSLKPDCVTYINALSSCACLKYLDSGRKIHGSVIEDGVKSEILEVTLLNMYGKCGALQDAFIIFSKMHKPGVIAWNALMSACVQCGYDDKALVLYKKMQQGHALPNSVTFMTALGACASLEVQAQGRIVHQWATYFGFESHRHVCSSLINVYGKYGALEDACCIFEEMKAFDVVVWNAMMAVYGQQGHGQRALELFQELLEWNMMPEEITFLNILASCSHTGLVEDGQSCFHAMINKYQIAPSLAICGCVVDLLGRAGQLEKAEEFIFAKSMQLHSLVWINMLSACKLHGDIERAKCSAECIFNLEPEDDGSYVVLMNMLSQEEGNVE